MNNTYCSYSRVTILVTVRVRRNVTFLSFLLLLERKETITVYFLPERSLNYRFSSGRSQYVVVTDVSLSYEAANKKCSRILGPGANLVNVTTEEEYIVINGALNAMDIEGSTMFWIAGYVNQPYKSFHKWGFCEPGCNLFLFLSYIIFH